MNNKTCHLYTSSIYWLSHPCFQYHEFTNFWTEKSVMHALNYLEQNPVCGASSKWVDRKGLKEASIIMCIDIRLNRSTQNECVHAHKSYRYMYTYDTVKDLWVLHRNFKLVHYSISTPGTRLGTPTSVDVGGICEVQPKPYCIDPCCQWNMTL